MRVVLCGKNAAAVRALEILVERGDEVLVVAVHGDDGSDGWQPSLAAAADRLGSPRVSPRRVNTPEAVAQIAGFRPDRLVSIQYDQILRREFFAAIGCPCLNLHFALLPRHRGVAPIAWALLEGDTEAGVTLHHMVVDIDGGDVIAQRAIRVGPEDTAREVYDRVSDAAAQLFAASHPFPDALLSQRRVQDARSACYHRQGDLDFSRRRVSWNRPAEQLQRWLRAMIFPPMQRPEFAVGDRRVEVVRVSGALGAPTSAPPGTVVAAGDQGLEVAAGDRTLWLCELADPAEPARSSIEILRSIEPSARLG